MPSLNEQELGNAVWAFAKWGRPPSNPWLERLLQRLPSCIVSMEPPAICSILWAAVMLELKLPTALVDAILLESQVRSLVVENYGAIAQTWGFVIVDRATDFFDFSVKPL